MATSISDDIALLKAHIRGHTRRLKSGKRVQVKPHDRRDKPGAKPEAVELPPKVQRGLKTIKRLDKLQKERSENIEGIYSTSAVGQAPPSFHRNCDQLVKVMEDKARVWNKIRHFVIAPSGLTLWQAAIKYGKFHIKKSGTEDGISATCDQITAVIQAARASAAKPHDRRGRARKAKAASTKRRWKVLGRHKGWVAGATITESMDVDDNLYRRFTATIHGYRNWKIWEGRMGRGSGIDMPALVGVIRERVREIMARIDEKDETVFHEPPKKFSLLTRKMKRLSEPE